MSEGKPIPPMLRVRSPNYPQLGLSTAIEQTEKLFKKIHTHTAPRDVVLAGLGYKTYNGASAPALSAQVKYGLLTKIGEDYKISDRAMSIIQSRSSTERLEAIRDAALSPSLFAEMWAQFEGRIPDDSLLRATLLRKHFGPSAMEPFIQAFRSTMELVASESAQYALDQVPKPEEDVMTEPTVESVPNTSPAILAMSDCEHEMLHGPLSRTVSYRLVVRGDAGPKDLGKLIKILVLQKSILEDEDD